MTEQSPFVSVAAFAKLRGVSRQAAHKWKAQGLLVLDDAGQVDIAASTAKLDGRPSDYRGGKTVNPSTDPVDDEPLPAKAERMIETGAVVMLSHADAVRKKENFLALLRELEYDRASGAVVEIADVVSAMIAEYALVRNRLLGIGAKLGPRVAVIRSPEEAKAIIDKEVAAALKELTLDGGTGGELEATRTIRTRFAPPA